MPGIAVKKIREYSGHGDAIYLLSPSGKEDTFLSGGAEGIVAEWDRHSGDGKAIVHAEKPIYSLKLIPERDLLVLGLNDGGIHFVEYSSKKLIKSAKAHSKGVFELLPLSQSNFLLASSADGSIATWNLDTFASENLLKISDKSVRTLVQHPENGAILAGSSDNHIYLFDRDLKPDHRWKAHDLSVFRLSFAPQSGILLSVGRDAHIRAWDPLQDYKAIEAIPAHNYAINDLVFHPNGWNFVTGSMDKSIKVWDGSNLELKKVIDAHRNGCHKNGINRLMFHRDRLLSCGDDRLIMEWELSPGQD